MHPPMLETPKVKVLGSGTGVIPCAFHSLTSGVDVKIFLCPLLWAPTCKSSISRSPLLLAPHFPFPASRKGYTDGTSHDYRGLLIVSGFRSNNGSRPAPCWPLHQPPHLPPEGWFSSPHHTTFHLRCYIQGNWRHLLKERQLLQTTFTVTQWLHMIKSKEFLHFREILELFSWPHCFKYGAGCHH